MGRAMHRFPRESSDIATCIRQPEPNRTRVYQTIGLRSGHVPAIPDICLKTVKQQLAVKSPVADPPQRFSDFVKFALIRFNDVFKIGQAVFCHCATGSSHPTVSDLAPAVRADPATGLSGIGCFFANPGSLTIVIRSMGLNSFESPKSFRAFSLVTSGPTPVNGFGFPRSFPMLIPEARQADLATGLPNI